MNFIKIYGYNASLEYTPTILVNMKGIDSSYSRYFSSTKQIDHTINYLNNL
ncbi:hypothetical protein KQI86_18980 [Clostridium sp. MSJ-11]|uniref:Uncharacterized protein n=1 Tax=Clostridium mobile TaxID=2841512 RepID=A0ABS6EMW9_9CLOT|nr:hypothetical protein [Clostridium mobile]MBU5486388.1 hypothetical protein [Clostridium mobile]